MSFEFFKYSSLDIARNLAAQGVPGWVFQYSWDLPGLGGYPHAWHTGDLLLLTQNYTPRDLAQWPAFDGIDRSRLGAAARTAGELWSGFVHHGDPGDRWSRFTAGERTVLWLGETIEARPGLLDAEWDVFTNSPPAANVPALEDTLVSNLRQALEKRT